MGGKIWKVHLGKQVGLAFSINKTFQVLHPPPHPEWNDWTLLPLSPRGLPAPDGTTVSTFSCVDSYQVCPSPHGFTVLGGLIVVTRGRKYANVVPSFQRLNFDSEPLLSFHFSLTIANMYVTIFFGFRLPHQKRSVGRYKTKACAVLPCSCRLLEAFQVQVTIVQKSELNPAIDGMWVWIFKFDLRFSSGPMVRARRLIAWSLLFSCPNLASGKGFVPIFTLRGSRNQGGKKQWFVVFSLVYPLVRGRLSC